MYRKINIIWIIQKKNLKEEIHLKVKLKEKYTPQVVPGLIVIREFKDLYEISYELSRTRYEIESLAK